jgi:hypothetical protein
MCHSAAVYRGGGGQDRKIVRLAGQLLALEEEFCSVTTVGCYFRNAAFTIIKCSLLFLLKLIVKFDKTQIRFFEPSLKR